MNDQNAITISLDDSQGEPNLSTMEEEATAVIDNTVSKPLQHDSEMPPPFVPPPLPREPIYQEMEAYEASLRPSKMPKYLLSLAVVAVASWFLFEKYSEDLSLGGDNQIQAIHNKQQVKKVIPNNVLKEEVQEVVNPYWDLPNILPAVNNNTPWSPVEEVIWRGGAVHKYSYQHFLTMQKMRLAQKKGSEAVFRQGLKDKKFWTRMQALFGLAEFGVEVEPEEIEEVLEGVRPSLVKNYLKRFNSRGGIGEHYILKQMIKIGDSPLRYQLVKLFAQKGSQDPLFELYVAAATRDPNPNIARYANRHFSAKPINKRKMLLAVLSGEKSFELPEDSFSKQARSKISQIESTFSDVSFYEKVKIENISSSGNVENKLNQQDIIRVK